MSLLIVAGPGRRVLGQESGRSSLPDGAQTRAVDVWSDGTRLSGDLFFPKGFKKDGKTPAVILTHGWGGVRSHLNQAYAPAFASAGYVVLTFDYRGWGDSDSRLVLVEDMPKLDERGEATVRVRAIRELVDPFDQTEDIFNSIDFIVAEPGVDPDRIGLWGTSYSGGHVVYVAANDGRIKCGVSQVPSMDSSLIAESPLYSGGLKRAVAEKSDRARGEKGIAPVPQGVDLVPRLRGTPYISRMISYRPVEAARRLQIPLLILDVAEEELFDIKDHGTKVYDLIKDRVPAKHHGFPGLTHYGVYTTVRKQATEMAIAWFNEHL
jgi:hypothetical protein